MAWWTFMTDRVPQESLPSHNPQLKKRHTAKRILSLKRLVHESNARSLAPLWPNTTKPGDLVISSGAQGTHTSWVIHVLKSNAETWMDAWMDGWHWGGLHLRNPCTAADSAYPQTF